MGLEVWWGVVDGGMRENGKKALDSWGGIQ